MLNAPECAAGYRRVVGRRLPPKAVGSTLLLKGLEADHCLLMDADGLGPRELYVALTRGRRSVTVISASPTLPAKLADDNPPPA
jgi:DNA helicase-2/ATP-dependent DNA helicase PcrA